MKSSLLLAGLIVMCAMIAWTSGSRASGSQEVFASAGWFHVLWGDGLPGSNPQTALKYFLVDDQGEWTELKLDDKSAVPLGGLLAFDRKRVSIMGEQVSAPEGGIKVRGVTLEKPSLAEPGALGTNAIIGTKKWVTILCRFSDSTSTTPRPGSYFDGLMSNTYPGMGHYWADSSYGSVNLTGSVVVGWYNLPRPRSYYVYGAPPHFDFARAVADATAVADADVYFPDFYGINFIFNHELDGFSWGGGAAVSKDGLINQVFGATYLPPSGYANQSRMAHEMGHGFGLPHSSGPYAATYDSQWDPMSALGTCSPGDVNYGCVGVHTISFHKDKLGWLPPGRKYVAVAGSVTTINIERLGQPISSNNYLMAQIPIGISATRFYTVEARLFAGYDGQVPGQAIIIHDVDTSRGDRAARVVDTDNNGNPNDAGAMWLPGETFSDAANHIQITVNSIGASSFSVTIANTCAFSISPNSQSFIPSGGTGSVSVTTDASCPWVASCNVDWVTITSGTSGTGNGTVNYSVTANTGIAPRAGTLSIAGQIFTISQTGPPPPPPDFTISASPSNTIPQGGTATYTITVQSLNGFNAAVSLIALNLPGNQVLPGTGVSPQTVTPPANASAISTFSFVSNTSTPTGTFTMTVQGQGGGLTRNTTVSLTVTPPVPTLLVDESSGRAAALDSVTSLRDPLSIINTLNFSLDQRTRVTLFAINVDLLPGENISVVSAQAEDAVRVYPLTVEFVGKVPNFDWLTQIVVKLPDALAGAGDVQVSVSLRGVPSNRVLVRTQ